MPKKALGKLVVLVLASLMAVAVRAADKPLDSDDVTLLLLGGASTDRMVALIEQRNPIAQPIMKTGDIELF